MNRGVRELRSLIDVEVQWTVMPVSVLTPSVKGAVQDFPPGSARNFPGSVGANTPRSAINHTDCRSDTASRRRYDSESWDRRGCCDSDFDSDKKAAVACDDIRSCAFFVGSCPWGKGCDDCR